MKNDNHNLAAKLDLRRAMILAGPVTVLDCFSGQDEAIWSVLRKEFSVTEYLALDIKKKRNRLKIDSLRYLQNQKWKHDIVDLDAYGSPWEHWQEVLKSDRQGEITVFLTIGSAVFGRLSNFARNAMGIPSETPHGMDKQLSEISVSFCLSTACKYGWIIEDCKEALNHGGNARYLGIRIRKNN
jgi:hypothetical protein